MDREEQYISDARAEVVAKSATTFDMLIGLAFGMAESPIERLFMAALIKDVRIHARLANCALVMRDSPFRDWVNEIQHIGTTAMIQQAAIGRYRVDLLIVRRIKEGANEAAFKRLVVECDGHDFHDRTKEQAARDRKRDRELAGLGYQVVRFTGSEIFRNPDACVEEMCAVWFGQQVGNL